MIWYCLILVWILIGFALSRLLRYRTDQSKYLRLIQRIPNEHNVSRALQDLITRDGAGSWPPQSVYGSRWPQALRPYHESYLKLSPLLAIEEIYCDSESGISRINSYRERVKKDLSETVDLDAVALALQTKLPPKVYNGFFACIAVSRHAYRWATIPIVKIAQQERIVNFPPELDIVWEFLQLRYGISSPGGNITSNYYCNYDRNGNLVYSFNARMPREIQSTEYHFGRMFPAMESLGLPVYYHMVMAIIAFERGQKKETAKHLQLIFVHLQKVLKVFFETLVDSKVSRKYWMRYVQGIQGWASGRIVDGKFIQYDGLSGNQLLLLHCVDAFVGLEPYLSIENTSRYIPRLQRELVATIYEHGFRQKAEKDNVITSEMAMITKQIRLFRASHRSRIVQYLNVPAPERLIMTAGKSMLATEEKQNISGAIEFLDAILLARFRQTR